MKKTLLKLLAAVGISPRSQTHFANIGEGTYDRGYKPMIADTVWTNPQTATNAAAARFTLVIVGAHPGSCAIGAANTEIPLGITLDQPTDSNLDVPVNVALLGIASGDIRATLGGTVAYGDELQSNGDGTVIKAIVTTGTWYVIGRAMMAGVAGDVIEVLHCYPQKRTY